MENQFYHIKIKKEYASALIEDLRLVDAIEIIEGPIPEWQKKETVKRLAEMKANSSTTLSEAEFQKVLDEGEE